MKFCEECGGKIGLFSGYNHPVIGKKSIVCGNCFTSIDEILTLWREFVLSNSFNEESSESIFNFKRENFLPQSQIFMGI
jgi:hypothetical protein